MGCLNLLRELDKKIIDVLDNGLVISIDINRFIESHYDIIKKYPFFYEREIDMLNRFLVQVEEEVQEFLDEDMTIENIDNRMDEYSDIILYLASILASLKYEFDAEISRSKPLEIHVVKAPDFPIKTINFIKSYMDTKVEREVSHTLFSDIRRSYPERKYHKIKKEKDLIDMGIIRKDRTNQTAQTVLDLIIELLSLSGIFQEYFKDDGFGTEYFIERLSLKFDKNDNLNR
jgi:hypothetical protein